ncbi:MAG: hypothetical protein K1Y02_13855 [Candidatus Hydrogenedentes bacterium]|nr:hypothetical protein [Candidatus Hydrogenedentota bacterium]
MNANHDRERLLNDYVDDTLSEEERRHVEAVVSQDPAAAAELAALQRIVAEARELPPSIEPSRDLWAGIAVQLEALPRRQPVRRRPWRYALVAAMVAGAFIGGLVVARRNPDDAAGPDTGILAAGGKGGVVFAEFQTARTQYSDAREALLAALETNEASLSPETRAVIDENLAVIHQAVADIEAAIAHDPGNRNLMELLVAAYDDELGLLRDAAALPREI